MDLKFNVAARISRPVGQVFEAVVNPTELSRYFTTGGASGRLETGTVVTWDFADFPGAFPVEVVEVEKDSKIVFRWAATDGSDADATGKAPLAEPYSTTVTMRFEALGPDRTLVLISETGWRESPNGLKACLGNCEGWTQMLCGMKVWLEHGIRLRDGMYK